jgi:hypothetical protein
MSESKTPLLKKFSFLTVLSLIMLMGWTPAVLGTDYQWIKGADGDWSESSSWSPSGVPNGGGNTATIDGSGSNVLVTITGNYTIGGLAVDTGDSLGIENNNALYLGSSGSGATVTNNGTIQLESTGSITSLTASGAVELNGTGSVVLNRETTDRLNAQAGYASTFVNQAGHIIKGKGQIDSTVTNNGIITADGGTLATTQAIDNTSGTMTTTGSGGILQIQSSVSGGDLNPNGGTVRILTGGNLQNVTIGSGSVEVTGTGIMQGTSSNNGSISVTNNNALYLGSSGSGATVTNNGTIQLESTGSITSLTASGAVELNGTGSVVLNRETTDRLNAQAGYASTFVNQAGHTIKGKGQINSAVTNNGTISADGGILATTQTIDNTSGTMATTGSGGILQIQSSVSGGDLNPNGGTVRILTGGNLQNVTIGSGSVEVTGTGIMQGTSSNNGSISVTNNNAFYLGSSGSGATVTNNGTIQLESTGSITSLTASGTVELNGTGSVVLNRETTDRLNAQAGYTSTFVNQAGHTIKGKGQINSPVTNNGTISAEGGTLEIQAAVTGDGTVSILDNATLNAQQNIAAKDLTMANLGILQVGTGKQMDLNGDYTFYQTDVNYWDWGSGSSLRMTGEGAQNQNLEVGGRDLGTTDPNAFVDNFNLPSLVLDGTGTYVTLVDNIDNGNRASPEALYVDTLQVNAGTTLYLNGINLYAKYGGTPVKVVAGDTRFGSGTILSISPGTYYVNIETGNDSNDGSAATAWKTLHYAIDQINSGSAGSYILNVAPGGSTIDRYSIANGESNSELTITQSNVTVIGENGGPATIDGTGGAANWFYGIKITGSNVTLKNLYITGFTGTDPSGTGVEIVGGSSITVENCRFLRIKSESSSLRTFKPLIILLFYRYSRQLDDKPFRACCFQ